MPTKLRVCRSGHFGGPVCDGVSPSLLPIFLGPVEILLDGGRGEAGDQEPQCSSFYCLCRVQDKIISHALSPLP